jgi:hypothetical protein
VGLHYCHQMRMFRGNQNMNICVISKMTPETSSFVEKSHIESVQLRSHKCSKQALNSSILQVSPQDGWDHSRLAFLRGDDNRYSGHVKFSGRMIYTVLTGLRGVRCDDFYVAWGGLVVRDITNSSRTRETVWVRLYWAAEWEGHSDIKEQLFMEADPDVLSGLEKDRIQYNSQVVEAEVLTMGDLGKEYFRININVDST